MPKYNVRSGGQWRRLSGGAPQQTVPGAPQSLGATAGDATADLSWSAPFDTGGSPVTGYTITQSPHSNGSAGTVTYNPGTSRTYHITGLNNGVTFTFTVHATNTIGASPESASATATPVSPANFNPLTYDWLANVGPASWSAARGTGNSRVFYGIKTLSTSADFASVGATGTGTAGDPYIVDGLVVRPDPAYIGNTATAGAALSTAGEKAGCLVIAHNYVTLRNVAVAGRIVVKAIGGSSGNPGYHDINVTNGWFGDVFDYMIGTATELPLHSFPTTSKWTGSAMGSAPFKEYCFNWDDMGWYSYAVGGSAWVKDGQSWDLIGLVYLAPSSPYVGMLWAQCNQAGANGSGAGYALTGQSLKQWSGSAWVDVAWPPPEYQQISDGGSHAGFDLQGAAYPSVNITLSHCRVGALEDTIYFNGYQSPTPSGNFRLQYCYFGPSSITYARYGPHGDQCQLGTSGNNQQYVDGLYIQRSRYDGGNYFRPTTSPLNKLGGFSSTMLVKDGIHRNILLSENLYYMQQNGLQIYSNGATPKVTPYNMRIRNCVFGNTGAVTIPEAGVTFSPLLPWTGNIKVSGTAIAVGGSGGVSTSAFTNDSDPTNEGHNLA